MKPFKPTKPPATTPSAAGHLVEVLELFSGHAAGPVQNITAVERRLAAVWDDLPGDDSGMRGEKLIGRTESMSWKPPNLRFRIERHGATVMGSTRAEVQEWAIDLERGTKSLVTTGRRHVRPAQPRADVSSVASEIATAVTGGRPDDRLKWDGENRVRLLTGRVFRTGSAVKETVAGRRKRLRTALVGLLAPMGWQMVRANVFELGGRRQVVEGAGDGTAPTPDRNWLPTMWRTEMKRIKVFLSAEAAITVVGSVVCEVPDDVPDEDVQKALEADGWELAQSCHNFVAADEGDFCVEDEATVADWRIADDSDGPPALRMGRDGTLTDAENPPGE